MAVYINTLIGGDITIGAGGSPAPATHADTWYKYAGDTEWRTVSISGTISGNPPDGGAPIPTTQIPDVTNVVALEIGTDVTSIGDWAFVAGETENQLASITIPEGVTSIGENAFNGDNITSLIIPESVVNVGEGAFAITALSDVTVVGKTIAQAQSLLNDARLGERVITTVHCTDGDYSYNNT